MNTSLKEKYLPFSDYKQETQASFALLFLPFLRLTLFRHDNLSEKADL